MRDHMLYPKNREPFNWDVFKSPSCEYRGAPFWAWNNKLEIQELDRQIDIFKQMGFGGFHMHVRTGLITRYLSDEFMQLVRACIARAQSEHMLAWLYDEDRWPSGAAGGLVTKDVNHRMKQLLLTRVPYGGSRPKPKGEQWRIVAPVVAGQGRLLACFDVILNRQGDLERYQQVGEFDSVEGFKLYAYEEIAPEKSWYNNQSYVDTLSKQAIQSFINITHERYAQWVSEEFGKTIPAIFTDEPQFSHKGTLAYANEIADVTLPWTSDLPKTYWDIFREDLLSCLPELLWDLPGGRVSRARYRYHDHIAERFAQAFADQCGNWCEKNGLMLTGHLMEEPTLKSQTKALGDAMRSYRAFHLPGIDMLSDKRELTTAKQAQSAARQYGRPGVLSELYGATNWDFDFRGHKLQGDWQAALGVTVRVPHLSWVSMKGEAKRDFPGTFNYQAPWHAEYRYIEDHFARLNTAMTRGKPLCRVGVLHPVESYWLHWGVGENTLEARQQMEDNFQNLCVWLVRGLVDFDYVCESTLPEQCPKEDISKPVFPVGEMAYQVVIVPDMETIRSTTLERLAIFRQSGGRVVFAGRIPHLVDCLESDECIELAEQCEQISYVRQDIMEALSTVRDIEINAASGAPSDNLCYQLRQDGDCRWLFLARIDPPQKPDIPKAESLRIWIRGCWSVKRYDTLRAEKESLAAGVRDGWTELRGEMYEHDSMLLRLEPANDAGVVAEEEAGRPLPPALANAKRYLHPVPVTLHEPNVLVLDMPEYALDEEPVHPCEEILKLDNRLRKRLGWPLRGAAVAQPWVQQAAGISHRVYLRYRITSNVDIQGTRLALEHADIAQVLLNGNPAGAPSGWYVDKEIETIHLPAIMAGENLLEIILPFGETINLEACYLLGSFSVTVSGAQCTLGNPIDTLCFGDITRQGLPFYGGNITYHLKAESLDGRLWIQSSYYRGQMQKILVDGQEKGNIIFSPYWLSIDGLDEGMHDVDVVFYGNRINTFGQIHCVDKQNIWWNPASWRTKDADWSYEYTLWPQGILKSPQIGTDIQEHPAP